MKPPCLSVPHYAAECARVEVVFGMSMCVRYRHAQWQVCTVLRQSGTVEEGEAVH